MNVLLVPCLAIDTSLVTKLADSVDYPIENKVVVNNGKRGALDAFMSTHPDWTVHESFGNKGCAASWNMADKMFPFEPSFLIANDDCWFEPGTLAKLAASTAEVTLSALDWSCFVWTRKAIDICGTFDENYWPVYWEDTDMRMRLKVAGITCAKVDAPMGHFKPDGHISKYFEGIHACHNSNKLYFEAKWGPYEQAINGNPFTTPFNKGGSIKDWTLDQDRRDHFKFMWAQRTKLPP